MGEANANLFIYGSLRDPQIFKSVSGFTFTQNPSLVDDKTLLAEPALLPNYHRVSPDNVYFYAVPDLYSRIEGLVVYDVPPAAMTEIDRYEGKRYDRETVHVNTARGLVEAQAYLTSHESMKKHFGDRFHVNLIHELWLRKRIESFLRKRTRPGEQTPDAELERRADRELLATTERDLVISQYRTDAISEYYIEHELNRPRPGIKHLYNDPQARPFINNYLALIVRQVLLNQLDEKFQSQYRFELEHIRTSERYFKRSVSLLASLQIVNSNTAAVDLMTRRCLKTMPYEKYDLIDYVKYAVNAADSIFDSRLASANLEWIHSNFDPGLVPLGVEIELSNLGPYTIKWQMNGPQETDPVYDCFRYFYDFNLDVFSWKLGGYIDDNTGATDRFRRTGFLEFAPGRLSITGELSRPATAVPWLLNQLINEIVAFYNVRPHSMHLSLQLRKNQIGNQQVLPLDFVKCLFVLGGGVEQKSDGKFWVSRMGNDEMIQRGQTEELVFARTSKRRWFLGEDEVAAKPPVQTTASVQQYKFIRLHKRANYEPLILGLKGLQLAYNPADYLTAEQLKKSSRLRREYDELKQWSFDPAPISSDAISRLIKTVQDGLMNERHHGPAHRLHHIDWALRAIDMHLHDFNKQTAK